MNLLLTAIRALAPELAEISMAPGERAGEFTRLLRREMLDAGQQKLQGIEFKVIYADSEAPLPILSALPEEPHGSAWQALPARDTERPGVPVMPLETIAPAPAASAPPAPQAARLSAQAAAAAAGVALPPGGTSLPPVSGAQAPHRLTSRLAAASPPGLPPATPAVAPAAAGAPRALVHGALAASPPAFAADGSLADAARSVAAPARPMPAAPASALAHRVGRAADGARPLAAAAAPAARAPAAMIPADRPRAARVPANPAEAGPKVLASADAAPGLRAGVAAEAQPASAPRPQPAAVAARPGVPPLESLPQVRFESAPDVAKATAPATAVAAAAPNERLPHPARVGPASDSAASSDVRGAPDTTAPRQTPASASAPVPTSEERESASAAPQVLKPGIDGAAPEALARRTPETAASGTPAPQAALTSAPQAAAPAPAAPPASPLAAPESLALSRQADAGEWGNNLGERVHYMINQKQNSATIRLDPPSLGKLEVQVRVADDATTITIQAQHPQARELIDAASYRLRDFLQDNGYQNVNVDVSQRQDQQQARGQAAPGDDNPQQDDDLPQHDTADVPPHQPLEFFEGDGLLDTFA